MTPTQAERRAATTAALIEAARELLAADGYAATSLDAVAATAGVTKGAVYHHFKGKRELFEAVLAREVEELTEALVAAYLGEEDPWEALAVSCRTFLDACQEPGLQQIVLLDGIAVLGWEGVREREAGLLDALTQAIERAVDAGRISPRPARPLANFLFGALCELAMSVARAESQRVAKREATEEVTRVLEALAANG